MKRQLFFGNILTLVLGGLIYVLFRTSSLKMFNWFEIIGLKSLTTELRKLSFQFACKIPEWILFSLPDGLWIFSYVSSMLFIWKNSVTTKNIFWISIIPILAIISETGQYFGLLSGTFDSIDLLFYLFGMTLPFIVFTNSINPNLKFK